MDFGDAIRALKDGKRVMRTGWNGKDMYLFLSNVIGAITPFGMPIETLNGLTFPPSICMKTAQSTVVVGWLASQTDMLAEDWEIVP
jgi:hypothetical protein